MIGNGLSGLEQRVIYNVYGKALWRMRTQPAHSAYYLTGTVLPSHERLWICAYFGDFKEGNTLASRGTSKCAAKGTKVIMADGSLRAIEDIRVGDHVMGVDSKPKKVLDTTSGFGPMYWVRQTSGQDYCVNDAHILHLKKSKTALGRPSRLFSRWSGPFAEVEVTEFARLTRYWREHLRGYKIPIEFEARDVPIDPYFLGLWLGDGTGHDTAVAITTPDLEVRQACEAIAEQFGQSVSEYPKVGSKASVLTLCARPEDRYDNPIRHRLRELGVMSRQGDRSKNKHIPATYLANSEAVRLEILAGLLDSDGNKDRSGYAFTNTNERLARDAKYLADTLGFRTNIYRIPTKCQTFEGHAWRVSINGDVWRIPCRVARKRYRQEDLKKNKDWRLSQITIEDAGHGEWFGFSCEDHLFLLEDCTVTHNSYTHASLAAPLKATLFKNTRGLTLSRSGFRGGKELLKDTERMVLGQLRSQNLPGAFLRASIRGAKLINRDPSMWTIDIRSNSQYSTVPTNNHEQLRGLRATIVNLDERAFMPDDLVHKIIRPMLNVGLDFRRAAQGGDSNQIWQFSTIDYTLRGWWRELQTATEMQRQEFEAQKARKNGDWAEYDLLMGANEGRLKTASFHYSRIDYTDLIIPQYVNTMDGDRRYRVNYPMETGVEEADILKYDEGEGVSYWYTYPVDRRGLEDPLRLGNVDEDLWLAEQRNIPLSASGNVFSHELLSTISERPVWTASKRRRKQGDDDDEDFSEFYAPLLWSSGDPCVMGVDYARESDESALVVIRVGELAEGDFDPFTPRVDEHGRPLLGQTPWNHICWAESWKHLQAHEMASKIRELHARFNIVHTIDLGGIGMDKRGGGTAVRDELGNPRAPTINGAPDPTWDGSKVLKMYDPSDYRGGFGHFSALDDPMYWSGLRLLATTNQDNIEWTYGMRALMQQKKLYLAYWEPPSRWAQEKGLVNPNGEPDRLHPEFQKWEVGYNGIRRLKSQLLRILSKVSEQGVMGFTMPGDRTKDEGKKDLWAAGIYATGLLRQHLTAKLKPAVDIPMAEPLIV
jgi:hypothetical protein